MALDEKNLILRFTLISGGIGNGSLKLTLLEGPVLIVLRKQHTLTNDIKDINQGTSLLQVMSKQVGEQIENI